MIINTKIGDFICEAKTINNKEIYSVLSIPYATAKRFEKPKLIERYNDNKLINSLDTYCFYQRSIPEMMNVFIKNHMMRAEFLTKKDIQSEDAFVINV